MTQKTRTRAVLLLVLASFAYFHSAAQQLTQEKLIGCWSAKSIEFYEPVEDSAYFAASFKTSTTCFDKNGKFSTSFKTPAGQETAGTGTYSLSADGKTLNQQSDAGFDEGDEPAEVRMISEKEIEFKIGGAIIRFLKNDN